jgi:4-hydroxy-tetrahydrodipicolinate reductase
MTDMRLVVAGAGGRMGQTLIRLIAEEAGVVLAGAVEDRGSDGVGRDAGEVAGTTALGVTVTDDAAAALAAADGLIDFTTPSATAALAAAAAKAGVIDIIGTTGLSAADNEAIDKAARQIPIVQAGNMSLGVNILARFVREAAAALDMTFDIEIAEMHHRHKVDAPSGTALLFGREAAAGRGIGLETHSVRIRDGQTGPRRTGDIGFSVMRGGTIVGDHRVIFAGDGETIELTHRAFDRAIFARGAIKAALWARGRRPGRYSMNDVLGFNPEK